MENGFSLQDFKMQVYQNYTYKSEFVDYKKSNDKSLLFITAKHKPGLRIF